MVAHNNPVRATLVAAHNNPVRATLVVAHNNPVRATLVVAHNNPIRATLVAAHNNPVRATLVAAHNNPARATLVAAHNNPMQPENPMGQPQGIAPTDKRNTVGDMVGAFQSIATVEYIRGVKQNNWQPFNGKFSRSNPALGYLG